MRNFNSFPQRMHTPRGSSSASRRMVGVAMMEVLVTMVILLVGLLGLAGIMVRASTTEMESYQRVQAVILAQDMVDRMNANRKYISCYSNGATGITLGTNYVGPPTCTTGTSPAEQALAVADLVEWDKVLKGATEKIGTTNFFGAMIAARGCITQMDAVNRIYRVSVAWQGLANTVAPADLCGKDLYGSPDSKRRVVTMTLRIGI